MTIEGRIAVDVGFSDSTSASSVQSLKRIALTSTDSYTSGKVAVISGTAGTAAVSVAVAPTTYRDSADSLVSFSSITRVVFKSTSAASLIDNATGNTFSSDGNSVAVSSLAGNQGDALQVQSGSGTVSYIVVLYGS